MGKCDRIRSSAQRNGAKQQAMVPTRNYLVAMSAEEASLVLGVPNAEPLLSTETLPDLRAVRQAFPHISTRGRMGPAVEEMLKRKWEQMAEVNR